MMSVRSGRSEVSRWARSGGGRRPPVPALAVLLTHLVLAGLVGCGGATTPTSAGDSRGGRIVITEICDVIFQVVFFEAGASEVAPSQMWPIDSNAEALLDRTCQGLPEVVEVAGHADPSEPEPDALAARRAEVVRAALIARGLSPARLRVRSYGATEPLRGSDSDDDRAHNRRVELRIPGSP
jgi:outer membrane protein OmpA-like peptidoglycan-associated protein